MMSQKQILFLMLIAFLILGVCWYVFHENASFIDALYICIIIITTVGYGMDDWMEDKENQLFLIFYIIFGVALITTFLNVMFVGLLDNMGKKTAKFYDADDDDCFTESTVDESDGGVSLLQAYGCGREIRNYFVEILNSNQCQVFIWLCWLFG